MQRIKVTFWLIVVVLFLGLFRLGIRVDIQAFDASDNNPSSPFLITFNTQELRLGSGSVYGHMHYGIGSSENFDYNFKNRGVSIFIGIVSPILLILLAYLFQPVILRKFENLILDT
jgi:hypothetical protein